jgi:hypothetical protein
MAFDVQPGDECVLTGDFSFEGVQAFTRGDIVKITRISSDRLEPGNKYVAKSEVLGRVFRLPGVLLKRVSCPLCRTRLDEVKPGVFAEICDCGWSDPEGANAGSADSVRNIRGNLEIDKTRRLLQNGEGSDESERAGPAIRPSGAPAEKARLAYVLTDIVVGGVTVFKEGDYVKVESEIFDPAMPDYKYVVRSRQLDEELRLSDRELRF